MVDFVAFKSKKINSDCYSEASHPAASAPIWKFSERVKRPHLPAARAKAAYAEILLKRSAVYDIDPSSAPDAPAGLVTGARFAGQTLRGLTKLQTNLLLRLHELTEATVERLEDDLDIDANKIRKALVALEAAGAVEVLREPVEEHDQATKPRTKKRLRKRKDEPSPPRSQMVLSAHQRILLGCIALANGSGDIKASPRQIGEFCDRSEGAVRRSLKKLERAGLIGVRRSNGKASVHYLKVAREKVHKVAGRLTDQQVVAINGALGMNAHVASDPEFVVLVGVAIAPGFTVEADGGYEIRVSVAELATGTWVRPDGATWRQSEPLVGGNAAHVRRDMQALKAAGHIEVRRRETERGRYDSNGFRLATNIIELGQKIVENHGRHVIGKAQSDQAPEAENEPGPMTLSRGGESVRPPMTGSRGSEAVTPTADGLAGTSMKEEAQRQLMSSTSPQECPSPHAIFRDGIAPTDERATALVAHALASNALELAPARVDRAPSRSIGEGLQLHTGKR